MQQRTPKPAPCVGAKASPCSPDLVRRLDAPEAAAFWSSRAGYVFVRITQVGARVHTGVS